METDVEEDEELSVLEYARSHGICIDYTTEQPSIRNIDAPSGDVVDQGFRDPSDASVTNTLSELTRERFAVNKDAVLLLKAVHLLQEAPTSDLLATDRRKWILGLKQELPILRTDDELDLLNFGSAVIPDFGNLRIPSEVTNGENDEGLEWPSKYLAYPAQCDDQAKSERLAVSKEVLLQLQDAIQDKCTPEVSALIKTESLNYKPSTAVQPLTPPLLPLSPPLTPYIPSSPASRLPLASDSSDSIAAEAKALEHRIMATDSLERKSSDSSDSMLLDITHPPEFSPLSGNHASPILKRKAEDLKVEGPLTPPMFSTSPMKRLKSVSFAETLHEFIPNAAWGADAFSIDDDNSSIDFDDIFRDIEPLATQARRKVENEQLSGADTTARVDIPDIDFSIPMAPWNEYSLGRGGKHKSGDTELEAQMKFLLRIKREDLKSATSWHGLSALERDLRWSIFTAKVSTVNPEEKVHGETELNKILAEVTTGSIATSSSQVWKREGLRILDDDDDDDDEEELELEDIEERRDMEALIRKRKLEIEEEAAEGHCKRIVSPQIPHSQIRKTRERLESQHRREVSRAHDQERPQAPGSRQKALQAPRNTSNELMFGGFSATTALHKFMETRGKPVEVASARVSKEPSLSRPSAPTTRTLPVRSRAPSSDPSAVVDQHPPALLQATDRREEQPRPSLPILPIIPRNLSPCSFIISSTFLQQRFFMKQVEQLYPSAEMVYRDCSLPHSAATEADILLSPSTGLIFSTLQQVKQRALPGHPNRSPVKERMTCLQTRYERLIVMVSEGLSREMEEIGSSRPDDLRDKETLVEFERFAGQLEGEVLVKYVRGGEQALARSTVVEMVNYGLPHGSADIGDIRPLAVETSWEVFLRRAGLNPFAAQVIVASLKQPYDVQLPTSSSSPSPSQCPRAISVSGLPAFMMMDVEERIKYFQALLGGSRILRSVSEVLDQEWVSAAHGFRM